MKMVLGLALGFGVGFIAAVFSLPSPSPPVLMGAGLVFSMTLGHIAMDKYMLSRGKKQTSKQGAQEGATNG